jgi:hypothetical protein
MIKGNNQSNETKTQYSPIEEQSMTEHGQRSENGRNLQILDDGPPMPQQPAQHHHCLIQSIPDEMCKRIKGNNGETVSKIKTRTAYDSHLRTPTPTQQCRPRFSTNIQAIPTQVASIHASSQYGCIGCTYVRIGWILVLLMVDVVG